MGKKFTLDQCNPKFVASRRHEIDAQLGRMPRVMDLPISGGVFSSNIADPTPKKRIRQNSKKTSALEERWGFNLREQYPHAKIYEQFPFKIGNGSNYYLDWLLVIGDRRNGEPLKIIGHEVKGPFSRTAGIVKLKAAASLYPWVEFHLVSQINGKWVLQELFP